MNWNRIEGYVKNDAKNLLSKLFGITTKNQKAQLKHLKSEKTDTYHDIQLANVLLKVENQKSQVLEYVRRFQNR
jgi:division protein CdvB (Snf7/Vps24/ESCRT-III family)